MQVKDIMSTDVAVVGRNDDLSQVEDLMATKKLRTSPSWRTTHWRRRYMSCGWRAGG